MFAGENADVFKLSFDHEWSSISQNDIKFS